MNKTGLMELIRNRENSGMEFNRDDVSPERLAREIVGLLNLNGGFTRILGGDAPEIGTFCSAWRTTEPSRDLPGTGETPEGMKTGMRYARNQTLVNIMRDYGYVDARGMGVRNKIIPGMRAHNGTEPDLVEEEHRFTVRLWKERH